MRRMLTCLMTCMLLFTGSLTVHAQSLFERLEQALTPGSAPVAPAAPDPPPTTDTPETLPAPLPTPPQADIPRATTRATNSRPTLGVTVDPVTDALVRQHRLPVRSGAIITAIVQNSPAAQAGLPVGGVIVALDGLRIDSPADLVAGVKTARTDRPIELSYYDGNRLYRKRVHLLDANLLPAAPTAPLAERIEPQPLSRRRNSSLAEQLSGQGQRPMLGRFGKILDGLVAPVAGAVPLGRPANRTDETALLHEQVHSLQEEVHALRDRLAAIEKMLEEKAVRPQTPNSKPKATHEE